ncbi:MAG: hypothetical protein KC583_21925, partial [Myxococcales bacterium]|nr:hypothetical protein [Myxococcales bacterium]
FGDVGFNDFEEVNVVSEPGQNFGWPLAEGPCQEACDGLTDPWFFYGRSNSHPFVAEDLDAVPTSERSVFVGWIYQPVAEDPYQGRWNDVMTFGDTIVGFIRARNIHGDGPDWAVGHLPWITGWAQAPDGYVYVTAMGTWPPADEGEAEQPSHILRAVLAD